MFGRALARTTHYTNESRPGKQEGSVAALPRVSAHEFCLRKTPTVLSNILHREVVSPGHKIESARELRAIAATGPEDRAAADRFIIHIDLGNDAKLAFSKSRAIDPDDVDPFNGTAPAKLLAAVAANKREDDGGGNAL
jgi:hypothetical protein